MRHFAEYRPWREHLRPGRSLLALIAKTRSVSQPKPIPTIPQDPADFATQTLSFPLDQTQQQILRDPAPRVAINCSRQWGKSTVAALKILHFALTNPNTTTLIASRTAAQAAELLRKVSAFSTQLQIPRRRLPAYYASVVLPNGSTILALPGTAEARRGISAVSLLVIDEAAYTSTELYFTLRPMLATTAGAIWLLSTPNGRQGFFYEACTQPANPSELAEPWSTYTVPATDCPRISTAFLDSELHVLGPARYAQEYLCAFNAAEMSVFDTASFDRQTPWPPFTTDQRPSTYYLGLDIGQHQSHSALVVLQHTSAYDRDLNPITGEYDIHQKLAVIDTHLFPLRTPFRDIIAKLASVIRSLARREGEAAWLLYDATGCGQMFRDLLSSSRLDASITGIYITAAGPANYANNYQYVSKPDLFETMGYALTHEDFMVSPRANAHNLRKALDAVQLRPAKNGAPRFHHTAPDDLAMALSLALWKAKTHLL